MDPTKANIQVAATQNKMAGSAREHSVGARADIGLRHVCQMNFDHTFAGINIKISPSDAECETLQRSPLCCV